MINFKLVLLCKNSKGKQFTKRQEQSNIFFTIILLYIILILQNNFDSYNIYNFCTTSQIYDFQTISQGLVFLSLYIPHYFVHNELLSAHTWEGLIIVFAYERQNVPTYYENPSLNLANSLRVSWRYLHTFQRQWFT